MYCTVMYQRVTMAIWHNESISITRYILELSVYKVHVQAVIVSVKI